MYNTALLKKQIKNNHANDLYSSTLLASTAYVAHFSTGILLSNFKNQAGVNSRKLLFFLSCFSLSPGPSNKAPQFTSASREKRMNLSSQQGSKIYTTQHNHGSCNFLFSVFWPPKLKFWESSKSKVLQYITYSHRVCYQTHT